MDPLPTSPLWRRMKPFLFPEEIFGRKSRPTRAGWAYFGTMMVVSAAAFNTSNNMLYLVLGLMLAALLGSFLISEYMVGRVEVTREAPAAVTEGVSFRVAYIIKNQKRVVPSFALRLTDEVDGTEVMAVASYVGGDEAAVVKGAGLLRRRGRVKFGELVLSTVAPFGWMDKQRRVRLAGEVVVLPATAPGAIDREQLASRGEERPRFLPGRGEDLFGFRDYLRGDPLKDVHWKTTARTGALTVREREADEERRLRIVLQLSTTRPAGPDPAREEMIRRAASLSEVAIQDGWQVRIECGTKGLDFGAGPAHLNHLLLYLALFDDPEDPAGEILPTTGVPAVTVN
jgi:uncharacterized protein (DUF58 family)